MQNFGHIYLSGGMEYAEDEGRDWRQNLEQWLTKEFGCKIFNPNSESERFFSQYFPDIDIRSLKETDVVQYAAIVARLVEIDCKEIAERSELVICYWDDSAQRGAGTKGELTIAKHFGKPVYMVTSVPHKEIPGWVLGCTTFIFDSFDELKGFLLM
jgi:hypothetical protein